MEEISLLYSLHAKICELICIILKNLRLNFLPTFVFLFKLLFYDRIYDFGPFLFVLDQSFQPSFANLRTGVENFLRNIWPVVTFLFHFNKKKILVFSPFLFLDFMSMFFQFSLKELNKSLPIIVILIDYGFINFDFCLGTFQEFVLAVCRFVVGKIVKYNRHPINDFHFYYK